MSSYQPGIPTGTVNLDVDYANIQNNFGQLDVSFGKDHKPFSDQTSENGYHTSIHMVPQALPVTVAGIGQFYNNVVNDGFANDNIAYWLTGNGLNIQMTSNLVPSANTNGYTFMPGGIIFQWGTKTGISSTGTVTFATSNINFPNNIFCVVATLRPASPPTTNVQNVSIYNKLTTSFNYNYTGGSAYNSFTWIAIGN